ncbi:MAG: hypothetical protein ABW171_14630 [Steroidobacter sp.]
MLDFATMNSTKINPDRLMEHVLSTYHTLRYGMVIITLLYPVVIYLAGAFSGEGLKGSLSDYYWSDAAGAEPYLPRTLFIGGLFAIAGFMYLYKGYTFKENVALNSAALLAIGVALVPTSHGEWDPGYWHGGFAVAMFLCLVYVVWFRARDTLDLHPAESGDGPATKRYSRAWYQAQYSTLGTVMLLSPVTAAILELTVGDKSYVFFIEAAGIWAFGGYWLAKSWELQRLAKERSLMASAVTTKSPELHVVEAARSQAMNA